MKDNSRFHLWLNLLKMLRFKISDLNLFMDKVNTVLLLMKTAKLTLQETLVEEVAVKNLRKLLVWRKK